ncbi:hypothetical protein [Streptomyces sp. NPDC058548]|uniref:hypothetical protein n=1 Tax=Streptomyces sp. NPDC058548 TaxID=3346545 RepID=UPI003666326B
MSYEGRSIGRVAVKVAAGGFLMISVGGGGGTLAEKFFLYTARPTEDPTHSPLLREWAESIAAGVAWAVWLGTLAMTLGAGLGMRAWAARSGGQQSPAPAAPVPDPLDVLAEIERRGSQAIAPRKGPNEEHN